ncbi:MAG TPA: histidinol-phosphate transaminase [Candidatus Methanofastidiosa archaeon]|nr:histidinol-phosphate transaminase [Candidatus Methanofastidiosa archaeon]HPR41371.1 histidinol-phosphate transaminase [Candidatus Methanofastidiosa archaeon]
MIEPNQYIRKVSGYVPPMEGRRKKIRMDFNENCIGPSPNVMKIVRELPSNIISTYPEYRNAYELFSESFGVDQSRILITNGSDEAIRLVFNAYVSSGDKIVIPVPTFTIFDLEARMFGADVSEVPFNSDLSFPKDAVIGESEGSRMTVIVNPNNPTGSSASLDTIERIAENADLVFVDEAYCEFKGVSALGLLDKYDNIIVTRTFSKAYGLAGLRIGLLFANEKIIKTLKKVISPYSVNMIAIECAMAAIRDQEHMRSCVSEIMRSRDMLMSGLRSMGFRVYDSDANFFICDLGKEHDNVLKILNDNDILVRDRKGDLLLENCVRISAGTMDECKTLLDVLGDYYGGAK